MIPDYQSLMLPLMKFVSDGEEHKYRDPIEKSAIEFQVTDEERKELLASGNQAIFGNRVGWAKTYLKKAGRLDSPKRATFVITDLGRKTLAQKPDRIDTKYLRQLFPALRNIDLSTGNQRAVIVREVFEGNNNYMKSGINIRKVLNKLNEIDFNIAKDRHAFGELYETIVKAVSFIHQEPLHNLLPKLLIRNWAKKCLTLLAEQVAI
jgi:restriction endonuclease Mrr